MAVDYVVDGSTGLKWLLDDEADTQTARDILAEILSGRARLIVPPHFVSEVGNGLLMAARRKRIDAHRITEAWADFLVIPRTETSWHPHLGIRSFAVARESSLTYYDAAYLALAAIHNAKLVTADVQASEAAKRMNLPVTVLR